MAGDLGHIGRADTARLPRLILSRRAVGDFDRCRRFLAERDVPAGARAAAAISGALQLLTSTPHAGRPVRSHPEFRELVIPFGSTGYVALYVFEAAADAVTILAIRHQRESGY